MPLLPKSLRGRAKTLDADPFRYLRGVLAFFLGGGAVVALLLALTGTEPRALVLAGVLWTLFGVMSGMVDWIVEPAVDFAARVLSNVGLTRHDDGFSAEETMAAQGNLDLAAEAYRMRASVPGDRVNALIRRARLMAGPMKAPHAAAGELEELQRDADRLTPREDMQVGLALTEVYEEQLADPGRAIVELRRLIDRYPHARQTPELRRLLAALRTQHFARTSS